MIQTRNNILHMGIKDGGSVYLMHKSNENMIVENLRPQIFDNFHIFYVVYDTV